jgi:phosphate starvation-inducible PhoH-like protein
MKNKNRRNKPDTSPVVPQKSKIRNGLTILEKQPLTEKQKEFLSLALNRDVKMIFVSGPAGTAKTYLSVLASLKLMNEKRVSDLMYIRSAVESSDSKLGFLPGECNEKMAPYLQPLIDKLDELLPASEVRSLQLEGRVESVPVGFLRGLSWNAKAVIADEAQNMTSKELLTLITRVGEFSKIFVLGDTDQTDIGVKSGFQKMFNTFADVESKENGIYTFTFNEDDIVRSKLVKFIIKKIKKESKKD